MIELLLHLSMTPILLFIGYSCWFLALSKTMSNLYLKYEPQYIFFSLIYRILIGFILLGIMNIAMQIFISYSNWVYN